MLGLNKSSNNVAKSAPPIIDNIKPSSTWTTDDNIIIVKPVNKQAHLRSQKPLKRIEITEVTDIQPVITPKVKINQEAVKTHVVEKKEMVQKIEESINSYNKHIESDKKEVSNGIINNNVTEKYENSYENSDESTTEVVSDFKKKQITRNLRNAHHHSAWPKPNDQSNCLNSDDLKIIEKTNAKDEKNLINSDKKFFDHDLSVNFTIPKNSVQFYSTWKNLKNPEEKYKYLKKINPEEIPKIFQNSLESTVFSSIVETLANYFIENKDAVSGFIKYFSKVKRFNTITMFLTHDDKSSKYIYLF